MNFMLEPENFDSYDLNVVPRSSRSRKQPQFYEQNLFPFNCIVFILGQMETGYLSYATGFLVSSCLVLTSAHPFCIAGNEGVIKIKPNLFF